VQRIIRFGIAGIPHSCKGRTIIDGIKDTANLGKRETGKGLQIMEIEMLRLGEDIGELAEIKKTARKCNIKLFVHAPYYTNLGLDKKEAERSIELIEQAAAIAYATGAELLIIHLGMYGKSKKETLKKVIKNVRVIRNFIHSKCKGLKLAIETSGKQGLVGTLEEIVEICKKVTGVVPLINFAHLHARGNGRFKDKGDFVAVFDAFKVLKLRHYYTHFSGVAYENFNELELVPIKKGDLRFEPFAELLCEKNYSISIISSSPLLEHDAINMKIILERMKEKIKKKKLDTKKEFRVKVKRK
jgi:deoxyribonuclease-4